MSSYIKTFINTILPEPTLKKGINNLKQNWYFPLTSLAFFYPEIQWGNAYCEANLTLPSMVIAFILILLLSSQVSDLWSAVRWMPWGLNLFVMLSAIGICWRLQKYAYDFLGQAPWVQDLQAAYPSVTDLPLTLSLCLALMSYLFVYVALAQFWKILTRILKESRVFSELAPFEIGIYSFLLVLSILFAARLFLLTSVFYDSAPGGYYDLIYTSDSGSLVRNMAWLYLTFPENDLRQPLFAVFSAPFVGAPYALSQFLGLSTTFEIILINTLQIVLLFVSNLMLARLLKLTSAMRVCFIVVLTCTYTTFLNCLMIEQYVSAYFWLILTLTCILQNNEKATVALYGAGGTLLTSLALLPVTETWSSFKTPKKWLSIMVRRGLGFMLLLLMCGRFDIFYSLFKKVHSLQTFTGKEVAISDRIFQFTGFVHDCFLAPAASIGEYTLTPVHHISWMLDPVEQINGIGLMLILLCLISFIIHRNERLAHIAAYWIVFSMVLLIGLGWGTQENGLILYTLYFGWAFYVLLFLLLKNAAAKLHQPLLLPLICLLLTLVLFFTNLHGVKDMLIFGLEYYPL